MTELAAFLGACVGAISPWLVRSVAREMAYWRFQRAYMRQPGVIVFDRSFTTTKALFQRVWYELALRRSGDP